MAILFRTRNSRTIVQNVIGKTGHSSIIASNRNMFRRQNSLHRLIILITTTSSFVTSKSTDDTGFLLWEWPCCDALVPFTQALDTVAGFLLFVFVIFNHAWHRAAFLFMPRFTYLTRQSFLIRPMPITILIFMIVNAWHFFATSLTFFLRILWHA